jgi:DNA-directed RNA polymerase II subunit RPB2
MSTTIESNKSKSKNMSKNKTQSRSMSKSKTKTNEKSKQKKEEIDFGSDTSDETPEDTTRTLVVKENDILGINDVFKLIDLYFKQKNIMYSHLHNSFDQFLDDSVRSMFKNGDNVFMEKISKDKIYKYKFEYKDIAIKPPTLENKDEIMFPEQARILNLTYGSKCVATVTQVQETTDIATGEVTKKVIGEPEYEYPIATIPIMVRSKYCSLNIKKEDRTECDYDPGGYFIINGSEKVVMSLERMIDNKPLVFIKKDASANIYKVQVNSKSYNDDEMMQMVTVMMKDKDKIMNIRVPILKEIPVFILFRALGVESDRDIINMCVYDQTDSDMINLLRISLENATIENTNIKIRSKEAAFDYLINKMRVIKKYSETNRDIRTTEKKMHLEYLLTNNFLHHVENKPIIKAYYLGYMINRLMQVFLGRIPLDDRDSYENKRIDTPGPLMFEQVKQSQKKILNECYKFFKKKNTDDENPLNIINQIKASTIEQVLKAALLKGVWGKKVGVSQKLERKSFLHSLSSLRRVVSLTGDASHNKLTGPRQLHNTSVGFMCYIETPEGPKVGLQKSLSMLTNITVMLKSQVYIIKEFLKDKITDLESIAPGDLKTQTRVFLNGDWLGMTKNPRKLYLELKQHKYNGTINPTTSINQDLKSDIESKEINIYCDGGRLYCPLIRVENNVLKCRKDDVDSISLSGHKSATTANTWNEFLIKHPGVIEYVDVHENLNSMVSMFPVDINKMKFKMDESAKLVSKLKLKDSDTNTIVNRYDDFVFVKYTHCIIHPSMMLGIVVNNIPFCNHNQAPRNIFQFSQAKSAMGVYASNYRHRLDIGYTLYNFQKPLVTTRAMKYIKTDQLPAGENSIVAIMVYGGANQEDSVVMNQAAIDRGLYRATYYKGWNTIIQKNQSTSQDDVFIKPDRSKVIGMRQGSYDKLNDQGYAPEETIVNNGDIIIGKVSPIPPTGSNNYTFKDNSEVYKGVVAGTVDRVWTDIHNNEGYEMRKTRIRSERVPIIGDKMCLTQATEVLTASGWVYINEITKKHKVASLIDGKYIKYVNPVDTYKFKYKGKMYKLTSQQVDLDVTMDHDLYVKKRNRTYFERIAARDVVGKRVRFKKDCENNYPEQTEMEIKYNGQTHKYDMDAFLQLLGIFIADGCLKKNSNEIQLSGAKQRKIDFMRTVCTKLEVNLKHSIGGIGSHLNDEDLGVSNRFIDKVIYSYLKPLNVGALNKFIPEFVWDLNQRQARILLESLISCDGTKNKLTGSENYYTSSKRLADDVMKLAIHAGWSGSIKTLRKKGTEFIDPRGNKSVLNADTLSVRIIKTKNNPQINHGHCHEQDGQKEEVYDYEGYVYCLEVRSHVFMTRLNNKNVWMGNCSRSGEIFALVDNKISASRIYTAT